MKISFETDFLNNLNISPNQYVYLVMLSMNQEFSIPYEDLEILEARKYIKIGEEQNYLRPKGKKIVENLIEEPTDNFIEEYRLLFKDLKKNSMGIKKLVEKNMARFKTLYPYTNEEILQATEKYINENSINDYKLMRQADYFIFKTIVKENVKIEISDLLEYCKNLEHEESTMV